MLANAPSTGRGIWTVATTRCICVRSHAWSPRIPTRWLSSLVMAIYERTPSVSPAR